MDTTGNIISLLLREVDSFKRELAMYPDDASLWRVAPGVSNSGGNLALHTAGNLQYFIGTVLGNTGYVRDRDGEFSRQSGTRDEVIAELNQCAAVIRSVLPQLSAAALESVIEPIPGIRIRTDLFLQQLCVHAGYHLGQLGYLRRIVTGDSTSSGALSLQPLTVREIG
jgi:hypothetical protein